jgi:P27 family predicted phage terminase small subunit
MRPGPAPKPAALKRLAGNPGKRELNRTPEIKPPVRAPRPPEFLGDLAKEEWRRIAPILLRAGLYTELDREALIQYCMSVADYREAVEKINQTGGKVLQGTNGGYYQNPWVAIANRGREHSLRMIQEFGLSPAAVGRVQMIEQDQSKPELYIPEGGYRWNDLVKNFVKDKEDDGK